MRLYVYRDASNLGNEVWILHQTWVKVKKPDTDENRLNDSIYVELRSKQN